MSGTACRQRMSAEVLNPPTDEVDECRGTQPTYDLHQGGGVLRSPLKLCLRVLRHSLLLGSRGPQRSPQHSKEFTVAGLLGEGCLYPATDPPTAGTR